MCILIFLIYSEMFYEMFLLNKTIYERRLHSQYILIPFRAKLSGTICVVTWFPQDHPDTYINTSKQLRAQSLCTPFSSLPIHPFPDPPSLCFLALSVRELHLPWSSASLCTIPFLRGTGLDIFLGTEMPDIKMISIKHK